jgi:SOS response regulatory protein OraA/RecX
MERYLAEKGFEHEIAARVVGELIERGFIDDSIIARDLISLGQRMNRGRSRIYADLRKRGINRSLAEESLDIFYDTEIEKMSILHLLQHGVQSDADQLDLASLNKVMRKMAQRGFPPGAVREAIHEMTCNKGEDATCNFP